MLGPHHIPQSVFVLATLQGSAVGLQGSSFINAQAQLRGMIGDYRGGDETVLATALEVFDTLSNTMAEYEAVSSPRAANAAANDLPSSRPGRALYCSLVVDCVFGVYKGLYGS